MGMAGLLRAAVRRPVRLGSRIGLSVLETNKLGGFSGSILSRIAELRSARLANPLIDTWRFPDWRPEDFGPRRALSVVWFIHSNARELDSTAELLADDASREWLRTLLAYRALGPMHVTLPGKSRHYSRAATLKQDGVSTSFPPFEMERYVVPFDGEMIDLECWLLNVAYTFLEKQYFFERDGVTIKPLPGDVVIDAGACFGDTALAFASTVKDGKVYSFEPLPRQREVLMRNLRRNDSLTGRVRVMPFALGEASDKTLMFSDGGAGARASQSGTVPVTSITMDDFVVREGLRGVDFIKMDIEGAETAALRGARETIRRFKPRLAVSIYHSLHDLVRIPQLVKSIKPAYSLYIDHHTIHAEETILYAACR